MWYAGNGCGEANKRSIDSKRGVTGDNYPAHNRSIVGQSLVSILRSREIPFPGSRKKIELVNIPNRYGTHLHHYHPIVYEVVK